MKKLQGAAVPEKIKPAQKLASLLRTAQIISFFDGLIDKAEETQQYAHSPKCLPYFEGGDDSTTLSFIDSMVDAARAERRRAQELFHVTAEEIALEQAGIKIGMSLNIEHDVETGFDLDNGTTTEKRVTALRVHSIDSEVIRNGYFVTVVGMVLLKNGKPGKKEVIVPLQPGNGITILSQD